MIVALDTTALSADPLCAGTAWKVLAHAGRAWKLKIYVPEVVLTEAVGNYSRQISFAVAGLDKVADKYSGRLGLDTHFAKMRISVADEIDGYEERLRATLISIGVEIIPPPDVSHAELVKRASTRRKPCNENGDGYRDTLNWHLVLNLAFENPNEHVYWVTNNSGDFADENQKEFHSDLIEDLAAIAADHRVHLADELSSLLVKLAEDHYDDSADSLRNIRERLELAGVTDFVNTEVAPVALGKSISPRRCGLPRSAAEAQIVAMEEITDLTVSVKGVGAEGGAFAEFSYHAQTAIGINFTDAESGLENNDRLVIDENFQSGEVKTLEYSGIVRLDHYGRPLDGEITKVSALSGDPGLDAWKKRRIRTAADLIGGNASILRAVQNLQRPLIDPAILRAVQGLQRPLIDPAFLRAVQGFQRPLIDPAFLRAVQGFQRPIGSSILRAAQDAIDAVEEDAEVTEFSGDRDEDEDSEGS